jgi:hypothetical protein
MNDEETRDGRNADNSTAAAAFAIFSEQAVNDVVAENEDLRTENNSLQAARDLLLEIRVLKGGEIFWTGSVLDSEEDDGQEDEDFLMLNVVGVDPFPLDEIRQLSCIISGFPVIPHTFDYFSWGGNRFSSMQDDNTVELNLKVGESCVFVGSLENYAGTIEYVRKMVVDNRLLMHMHTIGMLSMPTRTPVTEDRDDAVEGSTFRLTKIKLAKSAIQAIIHQESMAAAKAANDSQVHEFQALAEADRVNSALGTVLGERTGLLRENILLKSSRDTVLTVQVRHPGGSFLCDLSRGKRTTTTEGGPAWMVEIPPEEGTLSLLEVGRMRISLSCFPLSTSHPHTDGAQVSPDFGIVSLPYNGMVDAIFMFTGGWGDIDLESVLGGEHFVDWLRVQLCGGSNDSVTYSIPTYNGPELSMRLLFLKFHMGVVSQCLGALGIDVSEDSEEGEALDE